MTTLVASDPPGHAPGVSAAGRRQVRWSAVVASVFLLLFAGRGLGAWFWQDDFFWLHLGPAKDLDDLLHILFAPKADGNLRPWSENLFFYGLKTLFGLHPLPFRIVVFATLLCDLWLLDAVVRRLTGSALAALTAQVCWLANPCMAIVFTWSSSFCQAAYPMFVLAGLLLLMRGRFVAQAFVFVAGLGALEHAMMYPAVATLYAGLYERRKLRYTLPLFAISAAYLALHLAVAPPPLAGPHSPRFDARIFATFANYAEMALGPQQLLHFAWQWPRWLTPVSTLTMAGLVTACAAAAGRAGAFGAGTCLLLLVPVLPLPEHVMQYLLTGPMLGLGVILGAALASRWRRLAAWTVACYLACCLPAAWLSMTWHLHRAELARALVTGVLAHAHAHPDKTLLLTGMDTDQFVVGFADRPFEPFAVPDVYLAPGAEQAISDPWQAAAAFALSPERAWELLDKERAMVLDVGHGRVRDVTAEYRAARRVPSGR